MWEWLTNLFSGTPEQKRSNTTFTKPTVDQKAVSLVTPIPEMVRTFNQARTLPGNNWKSVSDTLFGGGESPDALRLKAANEARDKALAEPSFVDYTSEDLSEARRYAGKNLINTSQMNDQEIVDIWARDARGKAAKAAATFVRPSEPESKTTSEVDIANSLAFGNASDEVRELTPEEWAELTPIQQRAVEGNYALFESRDDPERQSEIFRILGMDSSDWGGGEIDGYASYDDILELADYAEKRADLPAQMAAVGIGLGGSTPAPKSPEMPNMDSLVALANSVYNSGQYEEDERPAFSFGSTQPILDEGMGALGGGQLTETHAKWLDENLLPVLGDDAWVNSMSSNQGYLDALYAEINENLSGLSKDQIAGYLSSAGDAMDIPLINGRLFAIGLLEG